jgi:hypothetical protein
MFPGLDANMRAVRMTNDDYDEQRTTSNEWQMERPPDPSCEAFNPLLPAPSPSQPSRSQIPHHPAGAVGLDDGGVIPIDIILFLVVISIIN